MSEHVRDVARKCAQSLHIIRVLCCRGMNDQALQAVYRSVVIAKLLNAACAWCPGFTTADDRNRIEAVVRLMGQRQRSSWRTLNTCCSAEFGTPPTTFYMNCCRTQTRTTTNSGPGAITCH